METASRFAVAASRGPGGQREEGVFNKGCTARGSLRNRRRRRGPDYGFGDCRAEEPR